MCPDSGFMAASIILIETSYIQGEKPELQPPQTVSNHRPDLVCPQCPKPRESFPISHLKLSWSEQQMDNMFDSRNEVVTIISHSRHISLAIVTFFTSATADRPTTLAPPHGIAPVPLALSFWR